MSIATRQVCTSSFNLAYHNTTDLHILRQSCLSQYDRSTLPTSVLLITQYDRSTLPTAVLLITIGHIYTSSFSPGHHNTIDLHFHFSRVYYSRTNFLHLSLLQHFLQSCSSHLLHQSCLLQHDRSTPPAVVLFITTRQNYTSCCSPVYYNTTDLHFLL